MSHLHLSETFSFGLISRHKLYGSIILCLNAGGNGPCGEKAPKTALWVQFVHVNWLADGICKEMSGQSGLSFTRDVSGWQEDGCTLLFTWQPFLPAPTPRFSSAHLPFL